RRVVLDVCGFASYKTKAIQLMTTNPRRCKKFLRKRLGRNSAAIKAEKRLEKQSNLLKAKL
ncbi:MAG: 60S ribosomal protein L36, partial [Paramarteilia canceri]